eukprot:TRINITY_DN2600_c0_g1_i4.p1 TRINITY_DN2600_c0_g1~~TRINITY_DN2600_c0_g1_i4.p1  ORF type:complete len:455 (+),score=84.47 TRINITY_DN2600_c0_g1_i4:356-1720(+)
MVRYAMSTLEDVFLFLCQNVKRPALPGCDDVQSGVNVEVAVDKKGGLDDYCGSDPLPPPEEEPLVQEYQKTTPTACACACAIAQHLRRVSRHTVAIAWRKLCQIARNPAVLLYLALIPSLQVFLFLVAIGPNPSGLRLCVVNDDGAGWNGHALGNAFVQQLAPPGSTLLNVVNCSTVNEATAAVEDAHCWGALHVPSNFSYALPRRAIFPKDDFIQEHSTLPVWMDESNYQVTLLIGQQIYRAISEVTSQLLGTEVSPVAYQDPVYGAKGTTFSDFLAPGMTGLIVFGMTIGMTAQVFVREKSDGTLDRLFAAGVGSGSMVLGTLFAYTAVLVVQVVLMIVVMVFGFGIHVQGSTGLMLLLVLLLGLDGMGFGLLIASVASTELAAAQITVGTYFPSLMLSGVLWPLSAVPHWCAADARHSVLNPSQDCLAERTVADDVGRRRAAVGGRARVGS